MADFNGDSGDNDFVGTNDSDNFNMAGGGEDTVQGNGGNDAIYFDGGLDAGDHIDGGANSLIGDTLNLDGDYSAGLVFADTTVVNVEKILLYSGHSYDLTFAAGTAVDGMLFVYQGNLGAGDHERIDASAFTVGHGVTIDVGLGGATLIGGAGDDDLNAGQSVSGRVTFSGHGGDDVVLLGRAFTHADRIDGGDGHDTLTIGFAGDYVLTGKMLKNVELLHMNGPAPSSLTMSDGNVANGQTLTLTFGQSGTFDGSAERSGAYDVSGSNSGDTFIGGAGADSLFGGGGDDLLTGGKGADTLTGGDGGDSFMFTKLSDSGHHKRFDLIADLGASDHIDLSAIDANSTKAGDQAFHIVSQLKGHVGELSVSFDAAANLTTVAGDVNGDGKADISFHITGDATGFTGWAL